MNEIELIGIIGYDITAEKTNELIAGKSGDLIVKLHSGGGSIVEGFAIFNALRAYKGNIHFIITGIAASMGSYIPMVADKISVYDNSVFMIHNGHAFASGDHHELRKTADLIEKLTGVLSNEYAKRTNTPLLEIKELMDNETYFYGKEIIDAGFADEIIETEEKKDKKGALALAQVSYEKCQGQCKVDNKSIEEMLASMPTVIADIKGINKGANEVSANKVSTDLAARVENLLKKYRSAK